MDKVFSPLLSGRDGKGPRGVCSWLPLRMWIEKPGGGRHDFCRRDQNAGHSGTSGPGPRSLNVPAHGRCEARSSRPRWRTFSISQRAMLRRPSSSTGRRSSRKVGKNCRTAPSPTNRPAGCSRVTDSSFLLSVIPLWRRQPAGQAAKSGQRKTRQAPGSSERKASLCRRLHRDV